MAEQVSAETAKENVLIAAGPFSIVLLPHFGGKISSILYAGRELLQAPLAPPEPRTPTMPFDASDASGWDECLPSVADCTVATAAGPAQIPDHGDLWRVAWEIVRHNATSITLRGQCFSLPLSLERTLTLSETELGWRLHARYTVTNIGSVAAPWSWAAHPLLSTEEGDTIELPESITELRVEGSGGGRLGPSGTTVSWPIATLANGAQTDLRIAQGSASGIGDKLFTRALAAHENWCALRRPAAGIRIRVSFDPEATPYLGLWICYGGWPDGPGPKQVCVALEPATAPVDSLAVAGPWSRILNPGQSDSWPMMIDFERL
jgi:galactose mutarotase-like enzyme